MGTQHTHHPIIKAALRGLQRRSGVAQDQAAPLMVEDLWTILDKTGDNIRDRRDRALLLVGFAGGLRRSELVGLDLADLEFVREGLIVTLRRSKTDQEGRGRRIGIPHARGRWCPVREVQAWIESAEIEEGSLFRSLHKGGGISTDRLSGEAVSALIKRHVGRIGLEPTKFSGHSLRAGFVNLCGAGRDRHPSDPAADRSCLRCHHGQVHPGGQPVSRKCSGAVALIAQPKAE